MKYAVIDIGSNAIRMQVSDTVTNNGRKSLKKLEYIRFPLRLGEDVFDKGEIGKDTAANFKRLMAAFKTFIDLYGVTGYMACATSAMREAENGKKIVAEVLEDCGLEIQIIDGETEANLINRAISALIDKHNYLHIDVGGGSTELNVYSNGQKIAANSFKAGSVRNLHHRSGVFLDISDWLEQHLPAKFHPVTAIGTGGNINKLWDIHKHSHPKAKYMAYNDVLNTYQSLSAMTVEDRINKMLLNQDRADVIVPAAEIYLHVMRSAKVNRILVPSVGLKDGMLDVLLEANHEDVSALSLLNNIE